jgi:hypothetical protein
VKPLDRRRLLQRLLAGATAGPVLLRNPVRAQEPLRDPPDEGVAWVCPMHPSYTAMMSGTCPICGMLLIQTRPYDTRDFRLLFRTEPASVRPGGKVTLFFTFLRPGSAEIVRNFEIVHTKPFHLFVVSQDMEFFEHIHPVMRADGTWTIDTTLPREGYYQVLCDFMPSGGSGQFLTAPLVTAHYAGDLTADSAHLVPDRTFRRAAGNLTATLAFNPALPVACQYVHLNFNLSDTASGRPVTDLQTYLGQFSHMLLMSEDLQCYVHSHPINLITGGEDSASLPEYIIAPDADLDAIRGGPQVTFDALMPKPGLFRAWAQFKRNDQIRTLPFTFRVAPGPAEPTLS